MSEYTDYMENMFYTRVVNVRHQIDSYEKFITEYTSKRDKYPSWITRDRQVIKIQDITDSHLNNLINYLKYSESPWYDIFICEKKYRNILKELPLLKKENMFNECVLEVL